MSGGWNEGPSRCADVVVIVTSNTRYEIDMTTTSHGDDRDVTSRGHRGAPG